MKDKSLSEALNDLGFTHRPSNRSAINGEKDILDANGQTVFTGTAWKTWEWLAQNELEGESE